MVSTVGILLLFHLFSGQCSEAETENYYSIGAHLAADGLSKNLQTWFHTATSYDAFKVVLEQQSFRTISLDEEILIKWGSEIDQFLQKTKKDLSKLAINSTEHIPSCNNIHELGQRFSQLPCGMQLSSSHFKEDLRLKPLNESRLHNSSIKRQFLFTKNMQYVFPPSFLPADSTLHWNVLNSFDSTKRNVIIFFDLVSVQSAEDLEKMRLVGHHLVDVLGISNRVMIRSSDDKCEGKFVDINHRTIKNLHESINSMEMNPNGHVSHSSNIKDILKIASKTSDSGLPVVMYISTGMSDLSDVSNIGRVFASEISSLSKSLKFNTLLVVEDGRSPFLWSTQFMTNLAQFNLVYNSSNGENFSDLIKLGSVAIPGEMISVQRSISQSLNLTVLRKMLKYDVMENENSHVVLLPMSSERTIIISEKLKIGENIAVAGVEIDVDHLMKNIFSSTELRLASAKSVRLDFVSVDGTIVKSSGGYIDVQLNEADDWNPDESWIFDDWRDHENGSFEIITAKKNTLRYFWTKLQNIPFLLVLRSPFELPIKMKTLRPQKRQMFSVNHMIWTPLLSKNNYFCDFNSRPVNFSMTSLSLFPNSLETSSEKSHQTYWVYISDRLGIIHSQDIEEGIREEVGVMGSIARQWILRHRVDGILYRFATTLRGVFVSYPSNKDTIQGDPPSNECIKNAARQPDSLFISKPQMDIYLGDYVDICKAVTLTNSTEVFAIVGLRVTTAFLENLMIEWMPNCVQNRKCVLFTNSGHVVSSTGDEVKSSATDVLERFHLSHVEPLLTSELTSNKKLTSKTICRDEDSLRREIHFNTSFTRVHTIHCGENSMKRGGSIFAEILAVPQTHLFLALINRTCDRTNTVFCPCSVHDRRCLFCGDSFECECPCTCPLNKSYSTKDSLTPLCEPRETNQFLQSDHFHETEVTKMTSCFQRDCSMKLHRSACVSTPGCEWCRFSSSFELLSHPRCTELTKCYRGVRGKTTKPDVSAISEWSPTAPVGPIVALVMSAFFLLVGILYCYRTQNNRSSPLPCPAIDVVPLFRGPDQSGYNLDSDDLYRGDKVALMIAAADTSFAQVPPSLRPALSDHGYSTMTDKATTEGTESSSGTVIEDPSLIRRSIRLQPMTSLIEGEDNHLNPHLIST